MSLVHTVIKKGEILFQQYDSAGTMYVIAAGKIRIEKVMQGKTFVVARLGSGDFLGEMALLLDEPRSATAIAEEDTKLLVYDKQTFRTLLESNTVIAVRIIQKLAERLKETTTKSMQPKK